MIFLAGGPPHQDMFDLKPDAPDGIRGEFRPIPTNVPGLDICEHMPRLARMMDKFAVIRSVVGRGTGPFGRAVPDRLQGHGQQGAGRPAQPGCDRLASARAGASRRPAVRRPLAADRRAAVGQSRRARVTWAWRTRRSRRSAPRRSGEAEAGTGRRRAEPRRRGDRRPQRLAGRRSLLGQLDGFRRKLRPRRRHARAWTASRSGPSRCSRRGGSSRRSTSPRKTRGLRAATASAT